MVRLIIGEEFPKELTREVELLRVLQEVLTNARRHSRAKLIVVTLKVEGSDLVAEISDDGQGFELEAASGTGSKQHARASCHRRG